MRLSRSYPKMENAEILKDFFRQGRPAMFVANHCSWVDIPFLGSTVGWRNYKLISKKELGIVPILGGAIRAGGNIMIDRADRKSQLKTLKQGINYLKVGAGSSRVKNVSVHGLIVWNLSTYYRMGSTCVHSLKVPDQEVDVC